MQENKSLNVRYYDGQTNKPHHATLSNYQDGIIVTYEDQRKLYASHELTYIGPIGDVLPAIELPNDARIDFLSAEVPAWINIKHKGLNEFFHKVERSWRWIALSFVMMLMIGFATIKWGIPYASYHIAMNLPETTLNKIGEQSEDLIVEMTEDTKLSSARQQEIIQFYKNGVQTDHPAKIIFREGGNTISANALAIPNGTIVLTDELIKLAKNDYEILGVLAHEQGHLDDRHSLQQALRGLGLSLIYVAVVGDASDLLSGLPLAMVVSNYSQEFELQADQRAVKELKRQNISPQYMADFLTRLTQSFDQDVDESDFLQSHPSTQRRIERIQAQINQ